MIELEIRRLVVRNPTWSATPANPGDKLTLAVEAPYITASEWIEFRILDGLDLVDVVRSKRGKTSAEWVVPNLEIASNLSFKALLRAAPKADNGQLAVLADVTSPTLVVNGSKIDMTSIDECFVPKQERLQAVFTVTATAPGAAAAGRYEVWGERYPGRTPQPLYTEDFVPVLGAPTTWNSWNGKANHGELSGHFITPEFSPYRLRVIVGADSASVKDPYGAGLGKVGVAETSFGVLVNSFEIRGMEDLKESASKDEFKLESALVVEPRQVDGSFADTGRLPKPARAPAAEEIGRIRIPMARHSASTYELMAGRAGGNQNALLALGDAYCFNGQTKQQSDEPLYTRPEIAVEIEPRLKSRDPTVNADVLRRGLFEPEAVGPLRIEPLALDHHDAARYAGGTQQAYWKHAAFKVKRGRHDAPFHDAATNLPEFGHWLARLDVVNDGDRDFDVTTDDLTFGYTAGSQEVTLYLNQTLLKRSDAADDSEIDDKTHDWREVPPGGAGMATQVRLRPDLTRARDVLWVSRADATLGGADAVERWSAYPPGGNCHKHYGGERGVKPTAELVGRLRAAFSGKPPKPKEPVIGRSSGGSFPFAKHVNLRIAPAVDVDKQERVECTALTAGKKKGLAGVIFSPSAQAGDSYKLHAWLWSEAYARRLGYVDARPAIQEATGVLQVWRLMGIDVSLRKSTIADAAGAHPGDATNLDFSGGDGINPMYEQSFCEWKLSDKGHQNADLKKYRNCHKKATRALPGRVEMASNAAVKDWIVVWDFYREQLPFGLGATPYPNLVANTIAAQPKGTDSAAVGLAVQAALLGFAGPDPALDPGVQPIPPTAFANTNEYYNWIAGEWQRIQYAIADKMLGRKNPARYMNVLRWPMLHENAAWIGYDTVNDAITNWGYATTGFCRGDGQTFMCTSFPDNSFPHEMGHSMELVHFVAGNFEWKHHDLNSPNCLMSYDHSEAQIWPSNCGGATVGPRGGGATDETGWPQPTLAAAPDDFCIHYPSLQSQGGIRARPCAKCALKVMGWRDDYLPSAWSHPDLY